MGIECGEKTVLFLFIFVPSLLGALIGYTFGYLGGRRCGRKEGTRKVYEEAVRGGSAVWEADDAGAPVIKWHSSGRAGFELPQSPAIGDTLE